MWTQILLMFGTALLSSVFTLALAAWLFETRIKPRLQEHVDEEVERAVEELGRTIEERVRSGVKSGVASLPSTEVLAGATRSAARTGADLMGIGLGLASLFGGPRRNPPGRPGPPKPDPDPSE